MKKSVIMAGGFGTRLRPLTMTIPKPMVPLLNVPMMEHIVNLLKKHGVHDCVSVLYFQPDKIRDHFGDGSDFGISMAYVQADADYGTAGSVRNAYEHLTSRFIIISGDVLTDFDLSKAVDFHKEKKSLATILLTRVPNPLQYGIVMTDDDGRVTRFLEKPSWGQVFSDTINTGIYILEPEVLDFIPYQREFDFSKDLFPLMLKNNLPLYGFISEGYWRDIGNLNEYQLASADVLAGKVELTIKGTKTGNHFIGKNVEIATSAKFIGAVVLGDGVTVGENAIITNTVIGKHTTIGSGADITNSVVWENVLIGEGATLTSDVICHDTTVGSDCVIAENVFIAEGCTIGRQARLLSNIKLWPHKQVESGAVLSRSLVQEEKWLRELFTDARVSGVSNIDINPEFAARLGSAIGSALGPNTVIVSSRESDAVSRMVHRAMTAGLMSVGVHINDLQVTSIPQARQELRNVRASAGFHVRKSPRDPKKTDIILFNSDGRDLPLSKAKTIERFFFGEDVKRISYEKVGNLFFPERTNETYVARFTEALNISAIASRKFKLVIDYSYGLASPIFPYILGQFHCTALSMGNYLDPTRHIPDTMNSDEEQEIAIVMSSLHYDLGFRIDSGAERIWMIDERGEWIHPMRLLSIVAKLFVESHTEQEPYSIAIPVEATNEIETIIEGHNVSVVRIKNSHSAMMEATHNKEILFVGGTRGGFVFPEFLFAADGMYSVAKILEMIALTNLRISEIDAGIPRRYQHREFVPCAWEQKGTVMRRAMEYSESMDRLLIDGIKVFLSEDSVLLYPDRERAAFAVIAESDDPVKAQKLGAEFADKVHAWRDI